MSEQQPLTAEQVRHEIALLRDLLEQKIHALDDVISARLDAMDKAVELSNHQSSLVDLAMRFEELVRRLSDLERKGRETHG